MLRRVRIKKLPQAKTGYQVRGSLYNDVPAMGGGADYNAYIGEPSLRASKYITAVPSPGPRVPMPPPCCDKPAFAPRRKRGKR